METDKDCADLRTKPFSDEVRGAVDVAHNTAAGHIIRQRRARSRILMTLEEIEAIPDPSDRERAADERLGLDRLLGLVQRLKPPDRQLMLLYLEDMDAISIGEIAGMSAGSVRTKIHRIKSILSRRFHGRQYDTQP